MKRLLLVFLSLLTNLLLNAQVYLPAQNNEKTNRPEVTKNLNINQDPRLDKMLGWHIENNRIRNKIEGFRVEVFFSSDFDAREKSIRKKKEFLSDYPDYAVHIKYISPNFRVRVGDFRTKNEALKLYREIKNNFPVAFIVADEIDFPLEKPIQYE
ncbi:MAG: hypothetical protein FD181_649 [Prolixibacteraceae bacterium]|nr:MAG: hypothetical protein FD181_649 [Prolixibacteraceae bacterium]